MQKRFFDMHGAGKQSFERFLFILLPLCMLHFKAALRELIKAEIKSLPPTKNSMSDHYIYPLFSIRVTLLPN